MRHTDTSTPTKRRLANGYTYLVLLFVVAIMGAVLAAAGIVWHTAQMREKERDLLFVGREYRNAIERYYLNPAPQQQVRTYPRELSNLIKDPRHQYVKRYLRKLYRDPITGKSEWGIVKSTDGGIAGIYSLSDETPFKTGNFKSTESDFEGKNKYSEWRFVYLAPIAGGGISPPNEADKAMLGDTQKADEKLKAESIPKR